jgi:hypothetical protein
VKVHLALCIAAFFATLMPAMAQDSLRGLAPADEYFGHFKLSVLGIANTIRDAGARMDSGTDPRTMLSGPLSFVTDAIKDWEAQYPSDPWIGKDLLALESVYLRMPTDDGFRLASQTEAWLIADYPNTNYASQGRQQLAENRIPYMPAQQPRQQAFQPQYQPPQQAIPSYATPWERFASLRIPIASR